MEDQKLQIDFRSILTYSTLGLMPGIASMQKEGAWAERHIPCSKTCVLNRGAETVISILSYKIQKDTEAKRHEITARANYTQKA